MNQTTELLDLARQGLNYAIRACYYRYYPVCYDQALQLCRNLWESHFIALPTFLKIIEQRHLQSEPAVLDYIAAEITTQTALRQQLFNPMPDTDTFLDSMTDHIRSFEKAFNVLMSRDLVKYGRSRKSIEKIILHYQLPEDQKISEELESSILATKNIRTRLKNYMESIDSHSPQDQQRHFNWYIGKIEQMDTDIYEVINELLFKGTAMTELPAKYGSVPPVVLSTVAYVGICRSLFPRWPLDICIFHLKYNKVNK